MTTRTLLRNALPESAVGWYRGRRLANRARRLARRIVAQDDLAEWWSLLDQDQDFRPLQKRAELTALLQLARSVGARRICEIGTASGGTLCGLAHAAQPDAVVVTIDLTFSPERLRAFPCFARDTQRVVCLEGDAHTDEMQTRVREALGGEALDLLFIDGDHSRAGVTRDFVLYTPLVRKGGVVVLHDIVPDFAQRYGRETHADTGGVPEYWSELRMRFPRAREIVEDPEQDGYGLGVLEAFSCA